jgi:N-acetyl-alpha-D-muramate 1-phosphate uridylyltransferase
MILPVVILCGGLSTRLQPLTENIPKSMIDLLGKPFIDHQLSLLKENGVKEVILCTGKFGDQIQKYVKDGEQWNMSVQYSQDGDRLLGTGGALKKALPILPDEFIVMNGDSYLDINYNDVIKKYISMGNPLLMTVFPVTDMYEYKNVYVKNKTIMLYDKSGVYPKLNYIDYGFTPMRKRLLQEVKVGSIFDFSIIYSHAISQKIASCYKSPKIFHEIGSYAGLTETMEYIKGRTL